MTSNPPPSGNPPPDWSGQQPSQGAGQPQYPPSGPQYRGPGQPAGPAGTGGQPPGWRPEQKGFFGALFDFGFHHFVTPSIIKVLYVLGFIAVVLVYLVYVVIGFSASVPIGLAALFIGWVIPLLYIALWRVMLEFFLAVVRMSEDIHHRRSAGL